MQVSKVDDLMVLANGQIGAIGKVTLYSKAGAETAEVGTEAFAIGVILKGTGKRLLVLGEKPFLLDPDQDDVVSAPAGMEEN